MNEKLRAHIESLFVNAPHTSRAEELKEELYADLNAKYEDLLARGKSEDEAFRIVVAGIGDVDALLRGLYTDPSGPAGEQYRRRSAGIIAVAVMLYILSVIPVIILDGSTFSVVVMFLMIAAATGMLVYNHLSRPHYTRADDTVVEEFKEWKSDTDDKRHLAHSINAALWPLIVVLYFIISFASGAWAVSWVVFPLGVAIQNIIRLALNLRGDRHE